MIQISYRPYRRVPSGKASRTIFCPNPKCRAKVTIKAVVGVTSRSSDHPLAKVRKDPFAEYQTCPECKEIFSVTPEGYVIAYR